MQVFLLPRHLAIVMEYAQGGNIFQYMVQTSPDGTSRTQRLQESHARWIFQQLVIGMDYCHHMVWHSLFAAGWPAEALPTSARLYPCLMQSMCALADLPHSN